MELHTCAGSLAKPDHQEHKYECAVSSSCSCWVWRPGSACARLLQAAQRDPGGARVSGRGRAALEPALRGRHVARDARQLQRRRRRGRRRRIRVRLQHPLRCAPSPHFRVLILPEGSMNWSCTHTNTEVDQVCADKRRSAFNSCFWAS